MKELTIGTQTYKQQNFSIRDYTQAAKTLISFSESGRSLLTETRGFLLVCDNPKKWTEIGKTLEKLEEITFDSPFPYIGVNCTSDYEANAKETIAHVLETLSKNTQIANNSKLQKMIQAHQEDPRKIYMTQKEGDAYFKERFGHNGKHLNYKETSIGTPSLNIGGVLQGLMETAKLRFHPFICFSCSPENTKDELIDLAYCLQKGCFNNPYSIVCNSAQLQELGEDYSDPAREAKLYLPKTILHIN
ncbi:hypothetical protein HN832_01080 [archaeon]|jgi:hypothetical protein|nr:hypothetical protein [archaeon]MBT4373805.1 hypothetical protein [archaeon]MBT4532271.1 hypothetical protein [archaeon]MBT7001096.1 hypothetical protein [archaeon]MBT7281985.1 hypothetical protein [archaeon]